MSYRGCTQGTRRGVPKSCIHVLFDGLLRSSPSQSMMETLEKHFWLPAASQLYRDKVSAIRWRLQKGSAMTAIVNNANTLHLMQQAAAWWWNKRIPSLSD